MSSFSLTVRLVSCQLLGSSASLIIRSVSYQLTVSSFNLIVRSVTSQQIESSFSLNSKVSVMSFNRVIIQCISEVSVLSAESLLPDVKSTN